MFCKKEKIYPAYVLKQKSYCEKEIILLMIPDWGWHYITEKIHSLLRGVRSKHQMLICIVWIFFILLEQKTNFSELKKYVKIKIFALPSEDTKILEFSQYQKSDKAPFIIYADLKCLVEKIDWCKNNPENLSTTKVGEHILSGFSMSTISSFKSIESKHDVGRGKDCMKNFCESLRAHNEDS